jgi:hypothetical protein
MIGVAQEKAFSWRGWRDGGSDAHPHFDFKRQAVFVNHLYFYILGPDWDRRFSRPSPTHPTACGQPVGVPEGCLTAHTLLSGTNA